MCGRYGAIDPDRIMRFAQDLSGRPFVITHNPDIRPTNVVPVLAGGLEQMDVRWGIQPAWAKKILINAQGETVAEKRTFAGAFRDHRCLIPLDCWYEWRDEGGSRKQKYRFALPDGGPMLMAGIWYPGEEPAMVSLTTVPNRECAEYHHRMPVFVQPWHAQRWVESTPDEAVALIGPLPDGAVSVERA